MNVWIRSGLLVAAWCFATPTAADVRPSRLLVLDAERAGTRLVAVGERGTVLLSDDQAQHWNVVSTGVTRTLTAVAFANEKIGVAVGHGGTLLRTADGGTTWTLVDVADSVADDSLLGITAFDAHRFVAVGAFGLYLESSDAGQTWERRSVLGEEGDAHLMSVFAAGTRLFVVGEAGTFCRSDDQGHTWQILESPYAGSFFGGFSTKDGTVFAYGMRGNVWRSADAGATWTQVDVGSKAAINGGRQLDDGRVVLSGNGGLLLISRDDGRTFERATGAAGDLAQVQSLDGDALLLVGAAGVQPFKTVQPSTSGSVP